MRTEFKEVPANACRAAGGELAFAAAAPAGSKNRRIRMLARSADPIDHWWWGRVVHDMAGMKLHKSRLPVDYEHWEPIGFLDKFDASNKGLFVEGELVPTDEPGDRTKRLFALSDGGVPYEASIYFGEDGIKYEFVGVAVCPYGADMHTESAFKKSDESFTLQPVKEPDMATATKPNKLSSAAPAEAPATDANKPADATPAEGASKPAEEAKGGDAKPAAEPAPAETPAPAPAAALSADRVECKRFVDAFGDVGGRWFSEGVSFEQAQVRFTKQIGEQNKELAKQNAELAKKLAAAGLDGEPKPVGFDAGDQAKKTGFAGKIRVR
jgi:hypothetical protein